MIRELVLVTGDFSLSPWFARGIPPAPRVPDGIRIETLVKNAPQGLFTDGPVSSAEAAARLSEGDTCHAALTAGGFLAAQMWSTERSRYIDWIGCDIRPPERHVHVYNSWVQPEFRGLGLQWNLAAAAGADVVARGHHQMCAGVERREYPPFARKYASMGLGMITPYRSIWSLRVFGMTAAVIPLPPPRSLDLARRNAHRVFTRVKQEA